MRYIGLVFVSLLTFLQFGWSQNPVSWEMTYEQVSPSEFDLQFTATIDEGWTVYSHYLESDMGPYPTEFNFDEGAHYTLVEKIVEKGDRIEGHDPVFDMEVAKFKKKVTFVQRVKTSDLNQPIIGYLTYMTCDNEQCLPPTDVDFSFQLESPKTSSGAADPKTLPAEETTQEEIAAAPIPKADDAVVMEKDAETVIESKNTSTPENFELITQPNGRQQPVKWYLAKQQLADNQYELIFKAVLDEDWILYSKDTPEGGPIPTTFYFDESEGFIPAGDLTEQGDHRKKAMDPVFNVDVIKFTEGEVIYRQTVEVIDDSQPVVGYIEYMSCNEEQCIPLSQDFSVPLTEAAAQKQGEEAITEATEAETSETPIAEYSFNKELAESECGTEGAEEKQSSGLGWIFLLGFGGGLLALLTPCVFPMIPLTVSFFTKSSKDRKSGLNNALLYGLSIIAIYVTLGLLVTGIFGADALNLLSTNAWFNIFFAVLFIIFAISFFGFFEITLPSSWTNKSDQMADRGGLLGIFFMAFTLSLVSFSCTGPIIGTLLVETATGNGPMLGGSIPVGPLMGMLGFSVALALPFGLFAAFPSWLNSLPKSGSWMNGVKVTLGFVELALAMKFLSVADLTEGWKILPYELFLGIWILCALGLAAYYFGFIRFPHDSPVTKIGPMRGTLGVLALGLAIYFALGFRYSEKAGTFDTPAVLSGLAPPAGHSYIYPNECPLNINCFKDFETGLAYAKEQEKPILLDFTGHGCVNCRKMEDQVWGEKGVYGLIKDEYVLVSLYVDDREKLDEPYISTFDGKKKRTIGNKWADFQAKYFDRQSQPYYVLMSPDGTVLNKPKAYTPNVQEYRTFLECGLSRFEQGRQTGLNTQPVFEGK